MQKFYAIDDDLFEERESLTCFKRTILAVYKADDTDQELASLRERVGELERQRDSYRSGLGHQSVATSELEIENALLLEAVRWCLEKGARRILWMLSNRVEIAPEPPEHLKEIFDPLIAEAVKQETKQC